MTQPPFRTDTHLCQVLPSEKVVAGPYILFSGSFEIEFLRPDPLRNASYATTLDVAG